MYVEGLISNMRFANIKNWTVRKIIVSSFKNRSLEMCSFNRLRNAYNNWMYGMNFFNPLNFLKFKTIESVRYVVSSAF